MATIQIRNIPREAYETIRRRARADGKSIQAYMRGQVIAMAASKTTEEVLAAIEASLAESGGTDLDKIVEYKDTDRR